jgi:microcystin degradation protein MlrC
MSFGDTRTPCGDLAWLQTEAGVDIVINTKRTQLLHPDAFEALGLDCTAYRLIVVKSSQHFYAGFSPLADEVLYVATAAGGGVSDFRDMPYTKRKTPYWPRTENPFDVSAATTVAL